MSQSSIHSPSTPYRKEILPMVFNFEGPTWRGLVESYLCLTDQSWTRTGNDVIPTSTNECWKSEESKEQSKKKKNIPKFLLVNVLTQSRTLHPILVTVSNQGNLEPIHPSPQLTFVSHLPPEVSSFPSQEKSILTLSFHSFPLLTHPHTPASHVSLRSTEAKTKKKKKKMAFC
jgi:hypothetical protein